MRKPSFITKPPAAAVGRYDHIKNSIWPKVVLSSHLNQLLARIIAEQKWVIRLRNDKYPNHKIDTIWLALLALTNHFLFLYFLLHVQYDKLHAGGGGPVISIFYIYNSNSNMMHFALRKINSVIHLLCKFVFGQFNQTSLLFVFFPN